ncbi:MAG: hypothetical protein QM752_00890 [Gammaproteobacteria bacterium]
MNKPKLLGVALSTALALTLQGCAATSTSPNTVNVAPGAMVKCYGLNSCRGQSSCSITTNTCKSLNSCRGQNGCQGKGWQSMTHAQCQAAGGTEPETPLMKPE